MIRIGIWTEKNKYATTSNVRCDENIVLLRRMCVVASEGLPSLIAVILLRNNYANLGSESIMKSRNLFGDEGSCHIVQ